MLTAGELAPEMTSILRALIARFCYTNAASQVYDVNDRLTSKSAGGQRVAVCHRSELIRGGRMDTEQVLNQLLLMAGLLAVPAPLLWAEARALRRVPRLAGQPQWRQRLALVPRVGSVGALLLAVAALALYIYYRLNPPDGLQSFLEGQTLGQDVAARVNSFYGLLSTVGSVTLGTLAVAYGLILLGFIVLAQGRTPERQAQTEERRANDLTR